MATLMFTIEVLIALFVRDNFVRPYLGDVLVVILIYSSIRSFINFPALTLALFVLGFSFTIELLQYFNIVEKLGLEKSDIARIQWIAWCLSIKADAINGFNFQTKKRIRRSRQHRTTGKPSGNRAATVDAIL